MKLQKLVYLAHGWHLYFFKEPLIREHIQAWKYGPVIPILYQETRKYGARPIRAFVDVDIYNLLHEEPIPKVVPAKDRRTWDLLRRIWDVYGAHSAVELSSMTHQKDTAWYETWHEKGGKNTDGVVIDNDLIKKSFNRAVAKNKSLSLNG